MSAPIEIRVRLRGSAVAGWAREQFGQNPHDAFAPFAGRIGHGIPKVGEHLIVTALSAPQETIALDGVPRPDPPIAWDSDDSDVELQIARLDAAKVDDGVATLSLLALELVDRETNGLPNKCRRVEVDVEQAILAG